MIPILAATAAMHSPAPKPGCGDHRRRSSIGRDCLEAILGRHGISYHNKFDLLGGIVTARENVADGVALFAGLSEVSS